MAYEVVMSYHLHMPSYFLGTFTEYPYTLSKTKIPSFTLSGCKARYLLCILLIFSNYAERQGFEPRVPLSTTVFKTAAIDHSATSPKLLFQEVLFS